MDFFGADCEWAAVHDQKLPSAAYSGGINECDEPMYVARLRFGGDCLPGYVLEARGVCLSSWGGEQCEKESFEVLLLSFCNEFEWVASSNGNVVNGAVRGGLASGDETLYIGRVERKNGYLIGKIQPSRHVCFVGLDGRERAFSEYEVLACCALAHFA